MEETNYILWGILLSTSLSAGFLLAGLIFGWGKRSDG